MALRGFQFLTTCLGSGHPALRGVIRSSATLTCSGYTTSPHHHRHTEASHNPHTAIYSHNFTTLTSNKHITSSHCKLWSLWNVGRPVLSWDCDNSVTGRQGCAIHHRHGGDRQADRHFILTPKGLFHASPPTWKPYLSLIRLDRPIGTWLLFLPCTWSISLAATPGCLPDLGWLALFALGSFTMRGAGCTINDMWDKDFDSRVARTKDRPMACGQITYLQALSFLAIQLSASLAILLTMNWNTVALGACAMIPVIIYPLMKRVTYWPQVFLGMTFNWGALLGWSAVQGSCDFTVCLPLYASGIAWTLVYDTIYAHQDKEDDILIGVRSTALRLGDNTKPWLYGFSSVMVGGLSTVGWMCDMTLPYYLGVSVIAAHVAHQIYTVDLNDGEDCGKKFRSNRNLGIMFWAAIVLANLIKKPDREDKSEQKALKH